MFDKDYKTFFYGNFKEEAVIVIVPFAETSSIAILLAPFDIKLRLPVG